MMGGVYFSPAEFIVMLDLAGDRPCSILFGGEELDDAALTQALASLFRRGLIRQEGGRLGPSQSGEMFRQMRTAPYAVAVSQPQRKRALAICYLCGEAVWMAEPVDAIVRKQYRVCRLDRESLRDWFFDTGLLSPPTLLDEDAAELCAMLAENPAPPPEDALLRLEKRRNGGDVAESFALCRRQGQRVLVRRGGDADQLAPYTAQALERMLADCFWREDE